MKQSSFVVYGLRDIYSEIGEYDFKVVLNPKNYSDGKNSDISMIDSDGKSMIYTLNKWGRKLNCKFIINQETADGVSSINLNLIDDEGKEERHRLSVWVIK